MKTRIRLTDKELGVIHRILVDNAKPALREGSTKRQNEDWYTLSALSNRACGNECLCGDSCTCGG